MTELNAKTITQLLSVSTRDKPNDDHEKMQFYYHPDHLGSSSYVTNLDGEVSQHIEYIPFGEVFIEERNKTRTKISWRMIVFNKKMMLFLKRQLISNRLSKGLADLLKEGITVNGQCIFFKRFYVNNPHITLDLFDDMTAYECFLNNVHIEDFCRKDIVSNAFIFADRLENILKEMKCGYEIILIIQRESCVLTFHSLHESEADWMDLCKIDDYKYGIALFRSQV